jgi:hypothetical protein
MDWVEEINAILDSKPKDFNEQVVTCNTIDEMTTEHIDSGMCDWDVPQNIQEALHMPEAMEAAQ